MRNFFPRVLGALGIHAALAALFWALVRFALIKQDSLATDLLTRLDGDPTAAQAYIDEVAGDALVVGFGGLLVAALLASFWLFTVHRRPPIGDADARSRRSAWAVMLLVALAAAGGFAWARLIGAPVAALLAPGVPAEVTAVALLLVLLGYWLSTGLFAPSSTKVAVPGGSLLGR